MNRLGKLFGMAMVAVALCAVPAGVEAQQLHIERIIGIGCITNGGDTCG